MFKTAIALSLVSLSVLAKPVAHLEQRAINPMHHSGKSSASAEPVRHHGLNNLKLHHYQPKRIRKTYRHRKHAVIARNIR
jgi:hypothetical protein